MTTTVAVIIPFYQKQEGILQRCLLSIFSQKITEKTRIKIIIVDDQSPIALAREIEKISVPKNIEIVCLAQKNGGPGSARNAALNSLNAAEIDFVAFLDSDDEWLPDHIATAIDALGSDADFYFCDHSRWYNNQSWLSASPEYKEWLCSEYKPFHEYIYSKKGVMEFSKNRVLGCFLNCYLSQTSTVVYRFSKFTDLLFEKILRYAGEDYMFWLDLCNRARIVRFSTVSHVKCGEGINMYFSTLGWDHKDALKRAADQLLFAALVKRKFKVNDGSNLPVEIWILQKTVARIAIKRFRVTGRIEFGPLAKLFKFNPVLMLTLPIAAIAAFSSSKWISNA